MSDEFRSVVTIRPSFKGTGQLLAKSEWEYWLIRADDLIPWDRVIIGCYSNNGYLDYEEFALSELPNSFISLGDYERIRAGRLGRSSV